MAKAQEAVGSGAGFEMNFDAIEVKEGVQAGFKDESKDNKANISIQQECSFIATGKYDVLDDKLNAL